MSGLALAPAPEAVDAGIVERVIIHGDLRQLTPAQKVSYYKAVCESVGLNPLTQPFQYLVLNGKEILYATRAATEQLRKVHAVSVQIVAREVMEDCYIVTARATLPTGRQDENIGAVPIAGLKGEARANAMMKAETKAKRRVTLAICGLGMLDETEVASIPGVEPQGLVVTAPVVRLAASESLPVQPSKPNGGDSDSRPSGAESLADAALSADSIEIPDGTRLVMAVKNGKSSASAEVVLNGGDSYLVYTAQLRALAEQVCQSRLPVAVDFKRSSSGNTYIVGLRRLPTDAELDAEAAKQELSRQAGEIA